MYMTFVQVICLSFPNYKTVVVNHNVQKLVNFFNNNVQKLVNFFEEGATYNQGVTAYFFFQNSFSSQILTVMIRQFILIIY